VADAKREMEADAAEDREAGRADEGEGEEVGDVASAVVGASEVWV
jgi:hypothetical protein